MSNDPLWEKHCFEYATKIGSIYAKDPEKILDCMVCDSVISFLNESYNILVKQKELPPIENIDQEEKLRLWEVSEKYGETPKKRTLICRSIYLLNQLTIN